MKKIKFILAIVLTLCIVTGSHRNVSAFAVSADNISPEIMFEIQRDACLANETLYASFEQNGTYIYPEDFSSVLTTGGAATNYHGYMLNPAVGTYLYKYGAVSGQAYCKVTATGITLTPDNGSMRIHNMTKAEIITGTTGPGDSGGPYRCGTDFCGIHHGSATQGGTATYVYFTPYTYIYNAGFRIETGEQPYGM